jgi:hypothetical protein
MPEFLNEVRKIIKIYSVTTGIAEDDSGGILNKYREYVISLIIGVDPSSSETFNKLFSGCVKLFPFIAGIIVTILYQMKHMNTGFGLAAIFAAIYMVMIYLETKLPKDAAAWKNRAQSLEMERAMHILAAQVNFYAKLDTITHDDDQTRIDKLSAVIDNQITTAINANSKVKALAGSDRHNQNLSDTEVIVNDIPVKLHEMFSSVAENICDACNVFFGSAKYSVKIYLRTKHTVNSKSVQMLTSIVKFPRKANPSNTSGGRSFLLCKGKIATVWSCFNDEEGIICKKNEPKNTTPETYYPSIVYIKLPQGIGVLTIVSSKETTFAENSNVTEDIKQTLMTATNTLCRVALEKFESTV